VTIVRTSLLVVTEECGNMSKLWRKESNSYRKRLSIWRAPRRAKETRSSDSKRRSTTYAPSSKVRVKLRSLPDLAIHNNTIHRTQVHESVLCAIYLAYSRFCMASSSENGVNDTHRAFLFYHVIHTIHLMKRMVEALGENLIWDIQRQLPY
jgi:hypothetical protein